MTVKEKKITIYDLFKRSSKAESVDLVADLRTIFKLLLVMDR